MSKQKGYYITTCVRHIPRYDTDYCSKHATLFRARKQAEIYKGEGERKHKVYKIIPMVVTLIK